MHIWCFACFNIPTVTQDDWMDQVLFEQGKHQNIGCWRTAMSSNNGVPYTPFTQRVLGAFSMRVTLE